MAGAGTKVIIKRKKGGGGGGHHGGSWKVAYADFVTAMMAFFMVMWILGMDDKTKNAIEGYFANPVGFKKGYGSGSSPLASETSISSVQKRSTMRMMVRNQEQQAFEQARRAIAERLAGNDSLKQLKALVDVTVGTDGLRVELVEASTGEVFFPSGSARVNPATTLVISLVGAELARLQHPVVLEGHTDAARYSSDRSYGNWELSADRANAARRILEASGVDPARVRGVRGYADTQLRVASDPLASANRRITILLPFSEDPAEGKVANAESLAVSKRDALTRLGRGGGN
ncbi:MAG: OmpA family protein [Gemmatimonadetes bacterium]|nr:OmpA family protein [Gemmatimonadota bacterium]